MDTVIERREPPEWVVRRITSLGGLNRFGKPNFRIVWGGNRTHLVGGLFKKPVTVKSDIIGETRTFVTQVAEVRTLLKYHPFRWHLERWRGPEFYGTQQDWYRDTWDEEARLHTMGDYPSEGDYEHVFFLAQCPHMQPLDEEWCMACKVTMGEYIPLEENIHILELQIRLHHLSDEQNRNDERAALFLREDKKRETNRKRIAMIVQNAMRPRLATQPTSWQDGSRCSVPEARLEEIYEPLGRSSFRQSQNLLPDTKQKELDDASH